MHDKKSNVKYYATIGLLAFGLLTLVFIAYSPLSPWSYWWEDDDATAPPDVKTASTFTLYSGVDLEVVSSFVEMDIWVPKSTATFDEGYEDITDLTNFERKETGKDADDISLDLRYYDWIWAEITGNTVFENTFYLLTGGVNRDYGFYVHHTSSDVNFNILDETMNELAYGTVAGGAKGVDANYTAVLKAPIITKTNCHYGDIGWEMTATEFSELTQRQKEIVWNENEWRDQHPTYDPTLDTSNEFVRDFEINTNTFGLKWTMNATINATDGATTEVNCTIAKGYPVEVWTSGVNLYMVWYEGFDFDPDPYAVMFELSFGPAINVTTVISGRANVYGSLSSLTWAETYSTIGA